MHVQIMICLFHCCKCRRSRVALMHYCDLTAMSAWLNRVRLVSIVNTDYITCCLSFANTNYNITLSLIYHGRLDALQCRPCYPHQAQIMVTSEHSRLAGAWVTAAAAVGSCATGNLRAAFMVNVRVSLNHPS